MITTRAFCDNALAISMRWRLATESRAYLGVDIEVSDPELTSSRSRRERSRICAQSSAPHLPAGRVIEEDVLGHRQFGEQQQFLIDDGDADLHPPGRELVNLTDVHAIDDDVAGIGRMHAGDDLDES